ncbi:MAG: hypothetical protein HS117_11560 [Verrucomicrobiaceae bacterium]|nr:hypothetical protein [Verrucomicrobiaceae bacterium]
MLLESNASDPSALVSGSGFGIVSLSGSSPASPSAFRTRSLSPPPLVSLSGFGIVSLSGLGLVSAALFFVELRDRFRFEDAFVFMAGVG